MLKKVITLAAYSLLGTASFASAQSYPAENPNMYNNSTPNTRPGQVPQLQVQRGKCFAFSVPAGWRVAEEGQYAVVLIAPDSSALTMLVGNCGLLKGTNPAQYVFEKLSVFRNPTMRMGQGRQIEAGPGFAAAYQFDYAYSVDGVPCRGVATVGVRFGYDTCDMIMTAAASYEAQWASYAGWLPLVASRATAIDGNAFGARGVQQLNMDISKAEGERNREYREYVQRLQDETTRQRNVSQDRNNADFRDNLGNERQYENPFDHRTIDLSASNTVYWVNLTTGQIVGSTDSSFDPRTPSDTNWQRMQPTRR